MVLRRPDGGVRPFVSVGVGYCRLAPGTDHEPLLHGAGLNAGVGTELRWSGVNLGLELGIRVFGGHLEGTSGQRSYAPLTLSLGW